MDTLQSKDQAAGKRELNRHRNRQAILGAAKDCFRERGYDNSTIRDIIRRTHLAAGTFYNYFSSKQDIFAALLTNFLAHLNDNMIRNRRSAETAQDFIYDAYYALYSATARDPLVYELAHRNDRVLRELFGSDILGLAMLSLEDDVRDAVERGLIPDLDQDYLCSAFFGVAYEMSLAVARRVRKSPDLADDEALKATQFSTALFLGGIPGLAPLP
jgi:AcrR family transcriptional regulator